MKKYDIQAVKNMLLRKILTKGRCTHLQEWSKKEQLYIFPARKRNFVASWAKSESKATHTVAWSASCIIPQRKKAFFLHDMVFHGTLHFLVYSFTLSYSGPNDFSLWFVFVYPTHVIQHRFFKNKKYHLQQMFEIGGVFAQSATTNQWVNYSIARFGKKDISSISGSGKKNKLMRKVLIYEY